MSFFQANCHSLATFHLNTVFLYNLNMWFNITPRNFYISLLCIRRWQTTTTNRLISRRNGRTWTTSAFRTVAVTIRAVETRNWASTCLREVRSPFWASLSTCTRTPATRAWRNCSSWMLCWGTLCSEKSTNLTARTKFSFLMGASTNRFTNSCPTISTGYSEVCPKIRDNFLVSEVQTQANLSYKLRFSFRQKCQRTKYFTL